MKQSFAQAGVRVLAAVSFGLLLHSAGLIGSAATAGSVAAQGAHPQAQGLEWVEFQDPFEQAFRIEVPRGCTARGGLFRMGFSDERPMVDVTSPDGRVNVRLGDLSIPAYTPPDPYHQRDGEIYDLGAQVQLIVPRYRTGLEFVVNYSHVRFYQNCSDAAADTEHIDLNVPDYIPSQGQPTQTSTGQIAYKCGGQRIAYAFARTTLTGNIWTVPTLGSFLGPSDQIALARQQQRIQELAQQVQQFEAKMQAMREQVSAFERRQNAFNDQVQGFDQALRGVTPTLDPYTGEAREVWTDRRAITGRMEPVRL